MTLAIDNTLECIFTVDYELFGDGSGTLLDHVVYPTAQLTSLFEKRGLRFVCFVEAAEFEIMETAGQKVRAVQEQVRSLYTAGMEIGLHIHPQWYRGHLDNGRWILDYSEYNLGTLSRERIDQIVGRAVRYLRRLVAAQAYTPFAFRAGNWLIQPTQELARSLAEFGIQVDSSVFRGGYQRGVGLDYRRAPVDRALWRFTSDVNVPDSTGLLLEVPTFTVMVPFWKMASRARLSSVPSMRGPRHGVGSRLSRSLDFLRVRYPKKFDISKLSLREMRQFVDLARKTHATGNGPTPIVAIGHTKDGFDSTAVGGILDYLCDVGVRVTTFCDSIACRRESIAPDQVR